MMEEFNKVFSRNLLFYMALNRTNQKELADALGVSQSAVSAWCGGRKVPRPDKISAICKLFNIEMNNLTTSNDPVPSFEQQLFYNEAVLFRKFGELSKDDQQIVRDLIERLGKEQNE